MCNHIQCGICDSCVTLHFVPQVIIGKYELQPADGLIPISLNLSFDCLHLMCVLPAKAGAIDCVNEVKGVFVVELYDSTCIPHAWSYLLKMAHAVVS